MTKIKNTKKGMAKKTLSMSLVVAMLATSNVPVWAAEFSDGSDAAVTAEVSSNETENVPVAEDTTETNDVFAANTTGSETVTTNFVTVPTSLSWDNDLKVKFTATGKDNNTTTPVTWVKYVWRTADNHQEIEAEATDKSSGDTIAASDNTFTLTLTPDTLKKYAGRQLELYIYRGSESPEYKFEATSTPISIKAKDISSYSLNWDASKLNNAVYDGKTSWKIKPVSCGAGTDFINITDDNFDISFDRKDDDFINAGKVTVTATPKTAAYTGSVVGTYDIKKKPKATNDDIEVKFNDNLSFTYTGNDIKLSDLENTAKLATAKDKHTGEDLTGAITNTWSNSGCKNVGEYEGTAAFNTALLKNYTDLDGANHSLKAENKFKITQRDLASDTVITCPTLQYKNGTNFTASEILNKLHFEDKDGNTLNLAGDVEVILDNNNIANVGTYTVTVRAKKDGTENTKGEQKITVSVEQEAIAEYALGSATEANGHLFSTDKEFTNEEVTLNKKDLGDLYIKKGTEASGKMISKNCWDIKGYENNVHAGKATVLIELKNGSGLDGKVLKFYFNIKPATVTKDTITVPEKVVYDRDITKAEEYKPAITVKAKNGAKPAKEFTLTDKDYTVSYKFTNSNIGTPTEASNEIDKFVEATITITNKDFGKGTKIPVYSKISYKSLTAQNIVIEPTSYVYTGGVIEPKFKVVDGGKELTRGTHYTVVDYTKAPNVGTATLTIKGNPQYGYDDTEVKATYNITAAKAEDVKVTFNKTYNYTGKPIYPDLKDIKVTLNGNDVTSQFNVDYGTNIDAGTDAGTVILTPKKGNKNFTGSKTATFTIKGKELAGSLKIYNEKGLLLDNAKLDGLFTYDGSEKTFSSVKFVPTSLTGLVEGKDYEIKYAHNTYGTAYVYVVGKGNYVGTNSLTIDDKTIKDVVTSVNFSITPLEISKTNVDIENGTYAEGLPVKPVVTVTYKGKTLVEGTDYKLSGYGTHTDVTTGKPYRVTITGINGYTGNATPTDNSWGIDKFDFANATVLVNGTDADPSIKVLNNSIVVDPKEYDLVVADGKATVTAKKDSKNYTGTKTVDIKHELEKPAAPKISNVKVTGNKATVVLSDEAEGASGYDYVISTSKDPSDKDARIDVVKNQVQTTADFKYVPQGTYYAYCHAWTRDENGKKVFGEWSNSYAFSVTAITPDTPEILSVKTKGSTITVTYKESANSTGYDVVLGKGSKKEHGETRPYQYGTYKKLNVKPGVCKAVFKNVPAGTYYAGVHSWNRTASENDNKVFSKWSNLETAKVK